MHKHLLILLTLSLILLGCPSSKETKKVEPSPPSVVKKTPIPDIIIKIASLNLAKYTKRIEKEDVERFAAILKKDTIDILALQGITRYPELTTRVDIVDELSSRAEMRNVFGETINISGRQSGNAVFSTYPIRSNENTHYTGMQSSNFESALQAVIDCGVRPIVIVSTQLPENSSPDDQSAAANTLSTFNNFYINHPIIISGNLPRVDALRSIADYDEARSIRADDAPRIWFSNNGSVKLINVKTENTHFGPLVVAHFGIFRQSEP